MSDPSKVPWQSLRVVHVASGRTLSGKERLRALTRWRNGERRAFQVFAPTRPFVLVAKVPFDADEAPMIAISREVVSLLLDFARRQGLSDQDAFERILRAAVADSGSETPASVPDDILSPTRAAPPTSTEDPVLELTWETCNCLLDLAERQHTTPDEAFERAVQTAWTGLR